MLEINSYIGGLFPSRVSENTAKMKGNQESSENFTNFRISEILKPDFGHGKTETTSALNLTCNKDTYGQINGLQTHYVSPHRLNPLGLQYSVFTHESLNLINSNLDIYKNGHNTNGQSRNHQQSANLINTNRNSGLSLDLTNRTQNNSQKTITHRTNSPTIKRVGSGGESAESSPATSPSASPGSSPSSSPEQTKPQPNQLWPAWVYCTRYSDRPSAGPRSRKVRRKERTVSDDKRPRTAFSTEQLRLLKQEFDDNKYLSENRRQQLARDLNLNESQIKIWFQNKRAKIKKNTGDQNELALELISQGLYNHKTVPVKLES